MVDKLSSSAKSNCIGRSREQAEDALMTSAIQRFLAGPGPMPPPPPRRLEQPYITTAPAPHRHDLITTEGPQLPVFFSQPISAEAMAGPGMVPLAAEPSPTCGPAAAAVVAAQQSKQQGGKTKRPRDEANGNQVRRSLQPPSTDAILAQRLVPNVGGMRPGELVQGVGLLPSLRAEFMKKYEKPPKGRRAPREDLTPYTAEEKVERRKARARLYSDVARKRQEEIKDVLKADIEYMRCFRQIVEDGPSMLAVLSCDLDAKILFANNAFTRIAHLTPLLLTGSQLWRWIHEADTQPLVQALTTVILTKKSPPDHVRCRLQCHRPDGYINVAIALRNGTQGIVCTLWEA